MAKQAKKKAGAGRQIFERLGSSSDVFTGVIMPADNDDESIMFARGTDCSHWIKIPASHIADVRFLRTVHCKDHTHPLVEIHMKAATTAEGETYSALARLHTRPVPIPHPTTLETAAGATLTSAPPIGQPTQCWDVSQGRWVPC
jgi:hypothetical protein